MAIRKEKLLPSKSKTEQHIARNLSHTTSKLGYIIIELSSECIRRFTTFREIGPHRSRSPDKLQPKMAAQQQQCGELAMRYMLTECNRHKIAWQAVHKCIFRHIYKVASKLRNCIPPQVMWSLTSILELMN